MAYKEPELTLAQKILGVVLAFTLYPALGLLQMLPFTMLQEVFSGSTPDHTCYPSTRC